MTTDDSPPGVGIVAQTPGDDETESGHIAVPMILNVLVQFHDDVHVFTRATAVMSFDHPDVHLHTYTKPFADAPWYLRLPGQLLYQLKFALALVRFSGRLDMMFFRGSGFIVPMVTARTLGMTVLSRVAGVKYRQERDSSDSLIAYWWSRFLEELELTLHRLSHVLILTTPHVARFAGIEQFEEKTHVWCHYYFDLDQFSVEKPYEHRDLVVGQVAVISETKGSMSFVEAMSRVEERTGARTLLVGDGPLEQAVRERCGEIGLTSEFTGRVPREDVPRQLNRMKLHVLSSVSEGLPKAAIEAMACGTPVAATPVGGLPDLISHGENGFLLPSHDPEEMANAMIDAVRKHDLTEVSRTARNHVEQNYSYRSAIEEYRGMVTTTTPFTLPKCPTNPTQPIEIP